LFTALSTLQVGAVIAGWAGAIVPAIATAGAALTGFVAFLTGTVGPALLAFFTGPVGWTVLAVAAVVAMAIAFREPIINFLIWIGENMASGFFQAWESVKAVTNVFAIWFNKAMAIMARTTWALVDTLLVQPLIFAFNEVIRKPVTLFAKWLTDQWIALTRAFDVHFIKPLVLAYNVTLRQPVENMATWVSTKWQSMAEAFNAYLVEPITEAWKTVTTFLPKAMKTAADAISGVWKKTIEGLRSFARGILNPIIDAVNQMLGGINDTIAAFNSLRGSDLPFAPVPSIPRFATGGYVTRPTLAMIGEGGEPEHVVPRSKVVSFSRAVLSGATGASALSGGTSMRRTSGGAAAMIRQGGAGSRNITLNTRVDKVVRQDGEDRVTLAQAQALASDAARQAVAQMDGNLKSPTYRQKLGIR
jgi:hypothetical protein